MFCLQTSAAGSWGCHLILCLLMSLGSPQSRTEYCCLKVAGTASLVLQKPELRMQIEIFPSHSFFFLPICVASPPGPCCLRVSGSFFLYAFPITVIQLLCLRSLSSTFRVRGEVAGSNDRLSPRAELGRWLGFPAPYTTQPKNHLMLLFLQQQCWQHLCLNAQ